MSYLGETLFWLEFFIAFAPYQDVPHLQMLTSVLYKIVKGRATILPEASFVVRRKQNMIPKKGSATILKIRHLPHVTSFQLFHDI